MNKAKGTCGTPRGLPCIVESPRRERGSERLFGEIIPENLPNLKKDI